MGKVEQYCEILKEVQDWEAYLLRESGLPGRRANIELGKAVARVGKADQFYDFLKHDVIAAPTNSPHEFLVFCGVLGLGELLAQGVTETLGQLRSFASDPRWRVREAVAMALQRYGQANPIGLLAEMGNWSRGDAWEKRAAAAALCEPGFLMDKEIVSEVLDLLDGIMETIERSTMRDDEGFEVLKKGMGYCWSVAVAASPGEGKERLERWFASPDADVRWIVNVNLQKKRLSRMDPEWVEKWQIVLNR
ncbi:MAG TPA: hypothetical protein VLA49_13425 [Anaerolineales bacterium]|nr:hypothetical protein [Anaerolineales bacterium]